VLSATSEGEGLGSEFRCELPAALNPTKVPRALTSVHTPRDSDHTGSASLRQVSRKPSCSAPSLSMTSPMHSGLERQDSVRNVMVVDDSGPTRKVVARLLRNAGYVCTEAVDGQDCLDQILAMGENPVHLILMDFEMPRMNGPTATAKLRELDYTMPIIGVTGNVLSADKDFFIAHGANSVLHKPLSIEQLKAEVSKINSKQGDSSGANFLSPSGSDQRGTNKSGEFGVEMV
jgi:CheY-like chemotaxis protein